MLKQFNVKFVVKCLLTRVTLILNDSYRWKTISMWFLWKSLWAKVQSQEAYRKSSYWCLNDQLVLNILHKLYLLKKECTLVREHKAYRESLIEKSFYCLKLWQWNCNVKFVIKRFLWKRRLKGLFVGLMIKHETHWCEVKSCGITYYWRITLEELS